MKMKVFLLLYHSSGTHILVLQRMLASAMQEVSLSPPTGESYGIPCGRDALEEFSPNFSVNQVGTKRPCSLYSE